MTQDIDLESVMRRVQKLLAIAEDARANPHEAAAAAAQAERIMRKYQLEHADVMRRDLTREDAFGTADVQAVMRRAQGHRPQKVPAWAQWISIPTARLNDCEVRCAFTQEHGAVIRFFGYAPDVRVAAYTFDFLVGATIRAVRAFQREQPRSKRDSEAFRRGYVLAVLAQLRRLLAERESEVATSAGRDLVVVKAAAIQERFGEFNYGSSKSKVNSNAAAAFVEGRKRGAALNVNRRGLSGQDSARPAIQ